MRIAPLRNTVQSYAWGSKRAIPELLGREPDGSPQAELWMGAHPSAPSRARVDGDWHSLAACIEERPEEVLGSAVVERFGPELPFLFKVLAADEPLSIQAHPSEEQARAGFARENAAGIPVDAPRRNYRDPHAKPELLCAITPFEALLGFRPLRDALERMEPLAPHPPGLADAGSLEALWAALLRLEPEAKSALVERAAGCARERAEDPVWRRVAQLAKAYPGDVGALSPLLLHEVVLAPGEAIFLAAGIPHSYLSGLGIELMANSDNVLRGGLTSKHVDTDELLRVLDFASQPPQVVRPHERRPGEIVYETPAREFELTRFDVPANGAVEVEGGAQILLCTEGEATARAEGSDARLARGDSAFVPDAAGAFRLSGGQGGARVFRARVPDRQLRRPC